MAHRIEIERRTHQALGRLPKRDRVRVVAAIDALAEDPRPAGCAPVRAAPKGTHRIRVGDYRVIYLILDDEQVIIVARVARRSETTYRKPG
ncbi:MAG TPA: type II toxin-antitoxin system RelE/ParE family toxin [Anaerolineae bacterium]|jgi:mRNA interferase RelE/StbE|nr:type II toxin-antitoxin system RelE/ParE family toxin [Anaerolineae bacterium]